MQFYIYIIYFIIHNILCGYNLLTIINICNETIKILKVHIDLDEKKFPLMISIFYKLREKILLIFKI